MKGMLFGFVVGVVVGAFAVWYYEGQPDQPLQQTRGSVTSTANRVKTTVQEKVGEIRTEEIKTELERAGMVVREKVSKAGEAISDATVDARTTATIKGKLLKEPGLSSLSISVDTTDSLVTLSGTARAHEEVARAVRLALDTEGVRKVVSRPDAGTEVGHLDGQLLECGGAVSDLQRAAGRGQDRAGRRVRLGLPASSRSAPVWPHAAPGQDSPGEHGAAPRARHPRRRHGADDGEMSTLRIRRLSIAD
jgi:hypothetical protein